MLFRSRAAPSAVPAADYFQVSRRAALAASAAVGVDIDLVLDAGAFDGVFADMVEARTGFRPIGERFEVEVHHPAERGRCADLLAELGDQLRANGETQLQGLRRHLGDLGVDDRSPLCLVDLGYSGTTQRALARVLPNPISGLYCVTTPAGAAAGGAAFGASDLAGACANAARVEVAKIAATSVVISFFMASAPLVNPKSG